MGAEVQGQCGQNREISISKTKKEKRKKTGKKKNNWKSVQVIPDSTLSYLLLAPGNTQHRGLTPLCTLSYLRLAQVWMPPPPPLPQQPAVSGMGRQAKLSSER